MKLKTVSLVLGPTTVIVGAMVAFNPTALTWPMVGVIAVVVGAFGALVQRLLED